MGAVTNLFYHARQEHTISAIFPNVRKTLPYKEHVTPATSKLSPGGAGGQIQKGLALLPFPRLSEKPCAVNNYLLNRLFVDGAGLF